MDTRQLIVQIFNDEPTRSEAKILTKIVDEIISQQRSTFLEMKQKLEPMSLATLNKVFDELFDSFNTGRIVTFIAFVKFCSQQKLNPNIWEKNQASKIMNQNDYIDWMVEIIDEKCVIGLRALGGWEAICHQLVHKPSMKTSLFSILLGINLGICAVIFMKWMV